MTHHASFQLKGFKIDLRGNKAAVFMIVLKGSLYAR